MFQVGGISCEEQGSVPGTTKGTALEPGTGLTADLEQNTPNLSGVSLSPPSLNGQTDTFWQIVRDNPEALPSQIANKLHAATGRNLTGAQVKALIAAGPSVIGPNDGFI